MREYLVMKKKTTAGSYIEFLSKALDNSHHRERFSYVYIDGKKAVATDGRRLHMVENEIFEDMKDGQYNLDISKKNTVFTYTGSDNAEELPWRKLLEGAPKKLTEHINLGYKDIYKNSLEIGKLLYITGEVMDLRFLRDICGYTWSVYSEKGEETFLYFRNDSYGLSAMIMPLVQY